MKKNNAIFVCNSCGAEYTKWNGKCQSCNLWNTIPEEPIIINAKEIKNENKYNKLDFSAIDDDVNEQVRFLTGISEFDRVCGGGIVPASAILIGGDPGIGKSTLLLQISAYLSKKINCIYISGEESKNQIKQRALRLDIKDTKMQIACSNSVDEIIASINEECDLLVIDSIQTIQTNEITASPGSISQIKLCSHKLITFCKLNNIVLIIVGHVTREGNIAGPKLLEHMVDSVFYFEGNNNSQFRVLRAIKNRFGRTDEIGIFVMEEKGLIPVNNPSEFLLSEHNDEISGTAVFAGMQGGRPILLEVQSLIAKGNFPSPKRAIIGSELNKLSVILAVLEARYDIPFSNFDVYLNISGGIKISEPGIDLAIVASLISSSINKPLPRGSIFMGEISLTGQVRNIEYLEQRISEASRLGFKKVFIPHVKNIKNLQKFKNLEMIEISNLFELINYLRGTK